ncbi:hypothetical protein O9X81_00375 [Agrobacterium salinitolerans]|uniref:hypothetical protein n=1 Tax=Agrobacterium salinitolerans TaxID=1183413 RepID=UPI0022B846C4|nr:hypothetical protein [Agrobacterium salinitolerans]MCZ7855063.1 hypothetical protein [Agrobacterium salinitolerans]
MSIFVSKPAMYVYAAIAAALLLWAVHAHVYNSGYEAAELHYKAEIAATASALAEADANEQRRQTIANNAAKKREAEALAEIAAREQEITELRKELRREAQQDPDAGRTALGSGSVQRINKIR